MASHLPTISLGCPQLELDLNLPECRGGEDTPFWSLYLICHECEGLHKDTIASVHLPPPHVDRYQRWRVYK